MDDRKICTIAADGRTMILEEELDQNYEPTAEEILEYAEYLGLDPIEDKDLIYIAKEGLKAPLPQNWKLCKSPEGQVYYFNFETGESIWDHPCDQYYKSLIKQEKEKRVTRQVKKKASTSSTNVAGAPRSSKKRGYGGGSTHTYEGQSLDQITASRSSQEVGGYAGASQGLSAGLRYNQELVVGRGVIDQALEDQFKQKMAEYEEERAQALELFLEEQQESVLDELETQEQDWEQEEDTKRKELERELENKEVGLIDRQRELRENEQSDMEKRIKVLRGEQQLAVKEEEEESREKVNRAKEEIEEEEKRKHELEKERIKMEASGRAELEIQKIKIEEQEIENKLSTLQDKSRRTRDIREEKYEGEKEELEREVKRRNALEWQKIVGDEVVRQWKVETRLSEEEEEAEQQIRIKKREEEWREQEERRYEKEKKRAEEEYEQKREAAEKDSKAEEEEGLNQRLARYLREMKEELDKKEREATGVRMTRDEKDYEQKKLKEEERELLEEKKRIQEEQEGAKAARQAAHSKEKLELEQEIRKVIKTIERVRGEISQRGQKATRILPMSMTGSVGRMHKRTTLRDGGKLRVDDIEEMAEVREQEQEGTGIKGGLVYEGMSPREEDEVHFTQIEKVKRELEIVKERVQELMREKKEAETRGPMEPRELELILGGAESEPENKAETCWKEASLFLEKEVPKQKSRKQSLEKEYIMLKKLQKNAEVRNMKWREAMQNFEISDTRRRALQVISEKSQKETLMVEKQLKEVKDAYGRIIERQKALNRLTEALKRAGSPNADMREVWEAHRYYIKHFIKEKQRKEREIGHFDEEREMMLRWQEFKEEAKNRAGVTRGDIHSSEITDSPSRLQQGHQRSADEYGFLSAEIRGRHLRERIMPQSGKTLISHIYKRDQQHMIKKQQELKRVVTSQKAWLRNMSEEAQALLKKTRAAY